MESTLSTSVECFFTVNLQKLFNKTSVAELHHFYAAPVRVKIFDAAPAPAVQAPAPTSTLLYSKAKFLK
jgi:hypothetical protein